MDAKELVERIAAKLTNDRATVKTHEDEFGATFEIFSESNALLVGKHRATIDSLRILAKAVGYNGKHRIRIILRERTKKTRRTD